MEGGLELSCGPALVGGEALFAYFSAGVAAYLERVAAWDGKTWDY